MQKLRDLYKETQINAKKDFDKVTQQRMKKILSFCNKEFNAILNNNDYTDLDEVTFYKEKFEEIVEIYDKSVKQGLKKVLLQGQVQEILKDDYIPQGQIPNQLDPSFTIPPKQQPLPPKKDSKIVRPPESAIQTYLDHKKEQIQRSKIGFKKVLQGIPYAPKKFGIKHSEISKVHPVGHPDRSQQIRALQTQIQLLRRQVSSKQHEKQKNMQFIQHEKKAYEDKISKLNQYLYELQLQNTRLKEQSEKNFPIYEYEPVVIPKQVVNHKPTIEKQEFKPYYTKYRENDINKIKTNTGIDIHSEIRQNSPIPHVLPQPFIEKIKEQAHHHPSKNHFDKQISSNIDFSSHIGSNLVDQAKTIAIKSKISFFKPSMVIYKGQDFEIAVKSSDLIQLELKRISIYVNNRSSSFKSVNLEYKFDRHYYEVKTKKKLREVEGLNQGREEVEVKLLNDADLDSLIEVHIRVDTKELDFLLPAMFIEFLQKRPALDRSVRYASKRVNPIHQFADLVSSSQLLPLEKQYGQLYETGRVYAISKHHEGYITFRWIGRQIQVQTIAPWRLFICYLLFKQY